MTNRYRSQCATCQKSVEAGQGIWVYGETFCDTECETVALNQREQRIAEEAETRRILQLGLIANALTGESDATRNTLIKRATKGKHESLESLQGGSAEDVNATMMAVARRSKSQRERETRVVKTADPTICTRCGGAGRADKWWRTGYVCLKCHGTGKNPQ
jgi:endogenous inhibitor of DNA gyrase (YacG/DUF329 family)